MRRKILATVAAVLIASGCAAPTSIPNAPRVEITAKKEPAFVAADQSEFRETSRNWNKSKLTELLRKEFSELAATRAELDFDSQNLILSSGTPYRRINFWYNDLATLNMHGTCSQQIHIWLDISGTVAGIYPDPMFCPI